jgi:hypothetical protein
MPSLLRGQQRLCFSFILRIIVSVSARSYLGDRLFSILTVLTSTGIDRQRDESRSLLQENNRLKDKVSRMS